MIDPAQLQIAADRILERPLAPAPPLWQLHGRVARIRRRRLVVQVTSGVVAAVLVVAGSLQFIDRAHNVSVRTVPPADRATVEAREPDQGSSPQPRHQVPVVSAPRVGSKPDRTTSTTIEGFRGDGWEGCRAYWGPVWIVESDAVTPSEESSERVQSCSYTATTAGGYEGAGTWTLDIVRDGRTITLDSMSAPSCQDLAIEPGDHVTAHLGLRQADGTYTTATAGSGDWHLSVGEGAGCFG